MAGVVKAAGGGIWGVEKELCWAGKSNHETGPCRMDNDPKTSYTHRFGQNHEVSKLYVCDASVFVFPTDKTTTMPIVAITLHTCEYMIEKFRQGEHPRGDV